jgi:adenosylhomocysteine nucleosidase
MKPLGIVTGLAAEAAIVEQAALRLGRPRPRLACAGADQRRAQAAAERLLRQGARQLVSFGLCGGLDPTLRPGDLVLPEEVVLADGRAVPCDAARRAALAARLAAAGIPCVGGRLLAQPGIVADAAEKRRLFEMTGAHAVDTESGGVARAAQAGKVGLLVIRAVADPARRRLPRAALAATDREGRLRPGAFMAALGRRPWEIAMVPGLARDAACAKRTLARVAAAPEGLLGGE